MVPLPIAATGQVTFLPTTDLSAVDAFYGGLLGLPLVRDQGVCRIYETSPGAYLGFCDRGYAVPSLCVRDPNGYLVAWQRFDEPLPPRAHR